MTHPHFFGWTVVRATFVLAVLGWGIGFYGPPVFLHAVVQRTGWPIGWVSAAVSLHCLAGALIVANLPRLYGRFGLPSVTVAGTILLAAGVLGWASVDAYWQLLAAAVLSGVGWVTLGAAAVNAIVSPWFVVKRPMALGMACNGASVGGMLFSPLWVWLMLVFGFVQAAWMIGLLSMAVIGALSRGVFSQTPEMLGQFADGERAGAIRANATRAPATRAPASLPHAGPQSLWRDHRFLRLAAGMSLGLFAQIGLIAHLFSMLVPVLGAQQTGLAMGAATLCAMLGRTVVAAVMPPLADRRLIAATAYAIQAIGSLVLLGADTSAAWLWLGIVLFGSGISNATSLPPLIAQQVFTPEAARRVVPLIAAISQASYAFAPMLLGWLRSAGTDTRGLYALVALIQVMAMLCFLLGRKRSRRDPAAGSGTELATDVGLFPPHAGSSCPTNSPPRPRRPRRRTSRRAARTRRTPRSSRRTPRTTIRKQAARSSARPPRARAACRSLDALSHACTRGSLKL